MLPWLRGAIARRLAGTTFSVERGAEMTEDTKKALPDHESDPARTPGDGWVGEGGASHLGPATHIASGSGPADDADEDTAEDDSASGEGGAERSSS